MQDAAIQGVFINICAWYWRKNCDLELTFIMRRMCNAHAMLEDCINQLIDEDIIQVVNNQIKIEFLDNQFAELSARHQRRVDAAKKRWSCNADAKQSILYDSDSISLNKKEVIELFDKFWDLYDYKKAKAETLRYWKKLSDKDRKAVMGVVLEYVERTHTDGTFPSRMYPQKFINPAKRRWEDELPAKKSAQETKPEYYAECPDCGIIINYKGIERNTFITCRKCEGKPRMVIQKK